MVMAGSTATDMVTVTDMDMVIRLKGNRRDQRSGIRNQESGIRDQGSGIRDQKRETRNDKRETRNIFFLPLTACRMPHAFYLR